MDTEYIQQETTYDIQRLGDLKKPILETVREMGIELFNDDRVRGMYIFGSQAYFAKVTGVVSGGHDEFGNNLISLCYRNDEKKQVIQYLSESDFDIILVVDDYKSDGELLGALASDMQSKWETSVSITTCLGIQVEFELDVSVYNTKYFISYMHYHQPVYNQSVTSDSIDEVFVIFEDERMSYFRKNWARYHLSIPRLIKANADEIDYCFEKAKRFFTISQYGKTSDERENFQDAYTGYYQSRSSQSLLKTARKNIVHAKRKLFFSKQMLANNVIVNYEEMNQYQNHVFVTSTNFYDWSLYETTFVPEFDKLERDFRTVCNTIIEFGMKLLEREKNAIDFLNNYCVSNSKCQSRLRNAFQEESSLVNKNCHGITASGEMESYVTNLFNNGIYFLVHLAGLRVLPFGANNSSSITAACLFQCSIPIGSDDLHPHLTALDGCIIQFTEEKYVIVSDTLGKTTDMRDAPLYPKYDEYLHCFKLPAGKKVSLFYFDNEWRVSCPELDYLDWVNWPLLKNNTNSWRDEFWSVWKQEGISLDEKQKDTTLLFIWNAHRLTFIGTTSLSDKRIQYKEITRLNSLHEDTALTLYIQDGFHLKPWLRSMEEESLKLNPKEYSGFLLIQGDGKVMYQLASPLHYIIPRLNLANKFYSGIDVLNKRVIENCTDLTLLQSDDNNNHILSCAVLADEYEDPAIVEECFKELNPVFRTYYLMSRKELIKDENKEHIPLLKEAAFSLEFSPEIKDVIDEIYYNAEGLDEYDDAMPEEED